MRRVVPTTLTWLGNISTIQWLVTGGGGMIAIAATWLAWLKAFPLPWLLFMALAGVTLVSVLAARMKIILDRRLELRLRARISELEQQLAAVVQRNAKDDLKHRDQMDAQANIASALREQSLGNR